MSKNISSPKIFDTSVLCGGGNGGVRVVRLSHTHRDTGRKFKMAVNNLNETIKVRSGWLLVRRGDTTTPR